MVTHSDGKGKEDLARSGKPHVGVAEGVKLRIPKEVEAEHGVALGTARGRSGTSQHKRAHRKECTKHDEQRHADFGNLFDSALKAFTQDPGIESEHQNVEPDGLIRKAGS